MLRCHSASVVSSSGAAEAMPALQTQMSIPPKRAAVSSSAAIMASSRVTSAQTAPTASWPCDLASA